MMLPDKNREQFDQFSDLLRAYRNSYIIFTAFEFGIFSLLQKKPSTDADLASELGLSLEGMKRLLAALCALGLINKSNHTFQLPDDNCQFFDPQSPSFLGGLIRHEIHLQKRWLKLSESISSGRPVKKINQTHASQDTTRFIKAMASIGVQSASLVLEKIFFKGTEKLLDLGGGPGKYIQAFVEKFPEMNITLFDSQETIRTAQKNLKHNPSYKNINFIAGDMLKVEYGHDYDVILLSNVIHIFGENDLVIIFKKCYNALKPGGRLLIKDFFLNENADGPLFATVFSIHMLLSTDDGKCYTEKEMNDLLRATRFRTGIKTTLTASSTVLEGLKT
jgi:ubiquinone/menaquinone biosynthesis C-methylase UbiE